MNVVENEIDLMHKIDHPHIVKLYGSFMHTFDSRKLSETQCLLIDFCEVKFFGCLRSQQNVYFFQNTKVW